MSDEKEINGILYHIRVKGRLDSKWANWFEDFVLISQDDGETSLHGRVADQAALHGVLGKINRLGLTILLVTQVDRPYIGKHCPMCGQHTDFI